MDGGLAGFEGEFWGGREIGELAVRPAARGTGLAGDLLEAVTEDAPEGRAWLLASVQNARAMAFYRRRGWTQATHPSPDGKGIVVFLGPRHPARDLAPLPL
ncbi:GNAT family N-acetyltransferase [Streptomyces chlorus]|uniref:GNAT family N-acetyltransferase n=1 Tax=Streptomyces chlorus TaxID=887452 RepID=A0ABW1DXM9_9ACTN